MYKDKENKAAILVGKVCLSWKFKRLIQGRKYTDSLLKFICLHL